VGRRSALTGCSLDFAPETTSRFRVFKTKQFVRHAHCQRLTDDELFEAVTRVEHSDPDNDLGHGLVRQRIFRSATRRRRSYCAILACRGQRFGIVLYAFPRNGLDDLNQREQAAYGEFAQYLLNLGEEEIAFLVGKGRLVEVLPS
jgi:hypothetical protein